MTWRDGTLQKLDRSLLGKGGIPTKNRVVMQFYSKATENSLAVLEMANGGGRTAKEFQKTILALRKADRATSISSWNSTSADLADR